jgi:chromosome segregation ATPase
LKYRFAVTTIALCTMGSSALLAQEAQQRLAASVQEARAEIQSARAQIQNTVGVLNEMEAQKEGDLRPIYEKYSTSVAETRKATESARARYDKMMGESQQYFTAWKDEIAGIQNPSIRKASEKRYKQVQKQYDQVLKKLGAATPKYGPMNSDLEDFRKALGMDLTPGGLQSLKGSLKKTNKSVAAAQGPIIDSLLSFDQLAADLTPVAR